MYMEDYLLLVPMFISQGMLLIPKDGLFASYSTLQQLPLYQLLYEYN